MKASLRLPVVQAVAVMHTMTKNSFVVAGLLKRFMLLKEDLVLPKLLFSTRLLVSARWPQNHNIVVVRIVKMEFYAFDIWVSARKLLSLLAICARSSNAMTNVV